MLANLQLHLSVVENHRVFNPSPESPDRPRILEVLRPGARLLGLQPHHDVISWARPSAASRDRSHAAKVRAEKSGFGTGDSSRLCRGNGTSHERAEELSQPKESLARLLIAK